MTGALRFLGRIPKTLVLNLTTDRNDTDISIKNELQRAHF